MDRRGFLLGTGLVLVAGCARVVPSDPGTAAPGPAAATLVIGSDGTPSGALLAELLCLALQAKGRTASVAPAGADWQASLGDGSLAALPAYAATLWSQLSDDTEPPAGADAVLSDVAGLLAPEVDVLSAAGVDGGLEWLVTRSTTRDGITSLDRIGAWSKGKVVGVPPVATSRADGVPGIKGIYHATFTTASVADPSQRAAQLASGQVALAAFRRTEYTGVTGLVALEDPDKLDTADPLVVLLDAALAEADPDAVLAMNGVAAILTTDMVLGLQGEVAGGASTTDAARRWLTANGLA
ncbi:MAG: glycine betaine ABC transporter substrate-binding protein [Propionicimonas sp.]